MAIDPFYGAIAAAVLILILITTVFWSHIVWPVLATLLYTIESLFSFKKQKTIQTPRDIWLRGYDAALVDLARIGIVFQSIDPDIADTAAMLAISLRKALYEPKEE